ncbi:MAG TPA: alpha/beta hydrolase [Solirubrobacteraceae bacterium]|nr:alpha/beta hydrolase [Solirubrobacteraceae bacterium]
MVVLHAGAGLDGSIFLPGAEALAATHRLLLVDLPGNGQSPEPSEWTLAAFARAVEELVRERGLEDWTLLGHSFGGYVAMQHLVDFPGSAARLIASCTDADEEPAPGAGDPEEAYKNLPPEVEAAFERENSVTSDEEARQVWLDQVPFFAPTPEGQEAVRAAFADVVFRHQGLRDHDWGDLHALTALATSEIPVLAVAAEHDRSTPVAAARRIAATAPRGELLVIAGAGHFPFAEAPEAYWGGIGAWFERTR